MAFWKMVIMLRFPKRKRRVKERYMILIHLLHQVVIQEEVIHHLHQARQEIVAQGIAEAVGRGLIIPEKVVHQDIVGKVDNPRIQLIVI